MKINVSWVWRNPIDLTEPQNAAVLIRAVYDAMGRVEPLTDFRFELAGIRCLAEYEVVETETEPVGSYVCVRIAFLAPGCGPIGRPLIAEDGQPGVEFEFEPEDLNEVILLLRAQ
jgi:hypothetical protein